MNYLIYLNMSLLFFFFSLFFFFMMMKFLMLKLKFYIEISLINLNSMNFSLIFFFDFKSFLFMSVVLLISSMIVIYSIEYMMSDKFNIRFIYILMLFVLSMLMMIIGQNLLMILLGWDGLGLISYCLVIYYNNWNSYNSGMLTVLTNRLGDIGLLILIGLLSMEGDWNYLLLNMHFSSLMFIMVMMACLTKSAQIPFSAWLPKAMAAPTPISALVHSSTLVTAGIYLMLRLEKFLINNLMKMNILFLSMMTMFFSGMVACIENDLKKIIALSTLSQLGLMMMSLLLKMKLFSFFHLIIHAMFKSLLFMCAGLILHSMLNNQDIRNLGSMNKNYFFTLVMFLCSNMALCGFPFMSGFYSKDLILEFSLFKVLNYFMMLIFYMSIMFTVIYTFRLMFYMILNYMKYYKYFQMKDSLLMNFSMMMMFFFSIISGNMFSWLIFNMIDFMFFTKYMKLLLNSLIIFSMMIGFSLSLLNSVYMMKLMQFYIFMNSLWMLNLFVNFFLKKNLQMSNFIFLLIEKGWGEVLGEKSLNYMFLNFMKLEKFNYLFIMLMLMIFYLFLILMIL